MTPRRARFVVLAVVLWAVTWSRVDAAERVHGADAVFATDELRIVWAVRKDQAEDKTEVVIRVANPRGAFRYVGVDGTDPFTKARATLVGGAALTASIDLRSLRTGFAEWPSRELHLYRSEAEWRAKAPSLTVYYLGVPDTTPEFAGEAALQAYLDKAAAK